MSYTVECPHVNPGSRDCQGCTQIDDGVRWCEGEVKALAYTDVEGDAGVIGGLHSFTAVEDVAPTCGCVLTKAEMDLVVDKVADTYGQPFDPSDDPQFLY